MQMAEILGWRLLFLEVNQGGFEDDFIAVGIDSVGASHLLSLGI